MLRCILLVSVVTNSLYAGNGCSSCAGVKTPTTKKYTVQPAQFKPKVNDRSRLKRTGSIINAQGQSKKNMDDVIDLSIPHMPPAEAKQAAAVEAEKEPRINHDDTPQEAPVSPTFVAVTPTSTTIRIIS